MRRLLPPAAWFIAVGCAAAAVHLGVVLLLVGRAGLPPLLANVLGWLVAFGVSFGGHHRLSFHHQQAPLMQSAWRFFMISAAGFAVNETAYALLLGFTGLGYGVALAAVLVGVALGTYVLSRHWAFRGTAAGRR